MYDKACVLDIFQHIDEVLHTLLKPQKISQVCTFCLKMLMVCFG